MNDDPLLGIGEISRASGLTVSALRFYDQHGVLRPARTDPASGYRRYSRDQVRQARLLAGMRRVQMPISEMVAVLEALPDSVVAQDLLAGHLTRLETGLADARREIARLVGLIDATQPAVSLQVEGPDLVRALRRVRHAIGTDEQFPMLRGALLDPDSNMLRVVATDRYRLVIASIGTDIEAPRPVLLPLPLIEEILAANPDLPVLITAGNGTIGAQCGAWSATAPAIEAEFPDYRRLVGANEPPGPTLALLPLKERVAALDRDQACVGLSADGAGDQLGAVSVDRAFLWEALDTIDDGFVVLPHTGEIAPLLVRNTDASVLTLLMPVHGDDA